jgi:hypothetical protein
MVVNVDYQFGRT